jgi:UDP-N-acetylglucosamine 2-epimerase (non-hydrolysing)
MSKNIDVIVGARPNFIKVAAILKELRARYSSDSDIRYRLIHTSQHYDAQMSGVFFEELNMPSPDINLNVGSITSSAQIATIIDRYSKVLEANRPDLVVVSGDVNSTVACALATKKTDASIPLVHVEAGLRCGDRSMPEEVNRILTDSISDYFFTTSVTASNNLMQEGVDAHKIFFVGNTMIDTLFNNEARFKQPKIWHDLNLETKKYYILTIHRQANIADALKMSTLLKDIAQAAEGTTIIFPVHPHTAKIMEQYGIVLAKHVVTTAPLGYLEFNFLVKNAKAVITDSGGISEETTVMNVPCMTLRDHTERPETCTIGTNILLGNNPQKIYESFKLLNEGEWQLGRRPELWDGKAASRIVDKLIEIVLQQNRVLKQFEPNVNLMSQIHAAAINLN